MYNERPHWDLEKLLSDPSFRDWVRNNHDAEKWEEWALESKERAKLVEEARSILLALNSGTKKFTEETIQKALRATWNKIDQQEQRNSKFLSISQHWLKYAAVFVIMLGISLWYIFSQHYPSHDIYKDLISHNEEGLIEHSNNSNKALLIILSDGSSVLLQPQSKLSYPKVFGGNDRKVFLTGEAFFEVRKDSSKTFYVYANEVVTKVYGTSFRVVAYQDQPSVEVLVRTGKVSVSSTDSKAKGLKNEILLLPNQAAKFSKKELVLEKISDITKSSDIVSNLSSIEKLSFEFKDVAVEHIFRTIEQAYLVDVEFPEEEMKNCYLTTSLNDLTMSEKFKIICESVGDNTTFVINGNSVKIFSKGCN